MQENKVKQIFQDLSSGNIEFFEFPEPSISNNTVKILTKKTLISAGTERMLLEFGKSSYLGKALKQPEKVKEVINKIKTDGMKTTYEAVRTKITDPLPIGYCNVGIVKEIGSNITDIKIGDRVISNGPHAEVVIVPRNLCTKVPDTVKDEDAVYTVLTSIGLQGIRLLNPTIGESIAVFGVGLIGLLSIQILLANGCRVLAFDFDQEKLDIAKELGAETFNLSKDASPVNYGMSFSRGNGIDGVLITASTASNDPISFAAKMSRVKGRIILVGVAGTNINRADFYEKELSFQVSCSYGPGRYDANYEELGHDYPFGYVRWTENRNFEAVLDLIQENKIRPSLLTTKIFNFLDASIAYQYMSEKKSSLGLVLDFISPNQSSEKLESQKKKEKEPPIAIKNLGSVEQENISLTNSISFVGAGNYASRVLIPAFQKNNAFFNHICSPRGFNGSKIAKKYGFFSSSTDIEPILSGKDDAVVIVSRHDSHAELAEKFLGNGLSVFVEKPLALNMEDLEKIKATYYKVIADKKILKKPILMIGFNRRFAPFSIAAKNLISSDREPKVIIMTVNAGHIPLDHWTQDFNTGGGRILGEACHFIDLARFLIGHKIKDWSAVSIKSENIEFVNEDKSIITLNFDDGSIASIHYLANGSSQFPKERIEVFSSGKNIQIDNFRRMKFFGYKFTKNKRLWSQDKGQVNCVNEFLSSIHSEAAPIPVDEIFEVSEITIRIANYLRSN